MDLATTARGRAARARTVALRVTVGLAAGAVLILTFLRLVNVGTVYQHLAHLNLGIALICGITFLAAYVVRAMRWRCLLTPRRVGILRAVAIYQIAIFLNWLLPIRGGEIAMSLLLRRSDGVPVSESLAAVSMDKAMDLLPAVGLLALMPFAGLRLSRSLWPVMVGAMAAVFLGAGFLTLAVWRRDRAVAILVRPLEMLLRGSVRNRVEPFISGFIDTLIALIRRPRILLIAAVYTVFALGLDALFCLLAFKAVGVTVPVLDRALRVYLVQFVVHPAFPARPGRKQRTYRPADFLWRVPGSYWRGGRNVPVLPSVDGNSHDVHRSGLPERDEPDPAKHIAPGARSRRSAIPRRLERR